jgi:hypothetical protein
MEDTREAWKDVADKVESLGLKLKLHLEQEQDDAVQERASGDTSNAFEQLAGQVTDAFDSFGNAAKDDAVHADVREIAELIKQALIATFQAVGAEVGDLMEQIEDYAEDAADRIAEAVGLDDDGDDGDDEDAPPSGVQDTVES